MTEETDAPEGGAEGVTTSSEAETVTPATETSADAAEQETGTEEPGQADETSDTPKRKPWWEKRFDELTAKVYEKEANAEYWRGIAEGRGPQQQPPEAQSPVAPPDRWEDPDGYDRWLIQTAVRTAREQTAQELKQQRTQTSYEERAAALRTSKPDFDTIVRDPTLPITPLMAEVIRESDVGPEVAYHLGTNRQEAARIAGLSPHRQAAELGKIEAALTRAPKSSTKPIPPAPPQTVGGVSSGLTKTLQQMSYTEFKKVRDAEEKNRN